MSAPRTPRFLEGVMARPAAPLNLGGRPHLSGAEISQAATLARQFRTMRVEEPASDPLPEPEAHAPAPPPPERPAAPPRAAPPPEANTARLDASIERLRHLGERLTEQARADAVEIAFAVARRLLERELSQNPQVAFDWVRAAVRRLGETRSVTVRASPADVARWSANGDAQLALGLSEVRFIADATLAVGDCVVEADGGSVDGRLETRIEALRRAAERAVAEEAA